MPGPIKVIDLPTLLLPSGGQGATDDSQDRFGADRRPGRCAKRPPQNIDFECTHPGPLAAGETKTLDFAIDLGTSVDVDLDPQLRHSR